MIQEELKQWLCAQAQNDYKEFSASLVPGCKNMLGVRFPLMRKKAKELAKGDWKVFIENPPQDEFFEETIMTAMMLGYASVDIQERISLLRKFVPRVDNWSINDALCSSVKLKENEREIFWDFLMEYKNSQKEYEVRVVAVFLMNQFLLPEYIHAVLEVLGSLWDGAYYASMGIAWAFATALAKFPEETLAYLQGENRLSVETYNRTVKKARESYRVSEDIKTCLKIKENK